MAWPTNSKASTTNVDSPTDSITSARADIQQNITNVNTIIDTFDIGGDSSGQLVDGDILKYDSASSKFIPVASTSIGGGSSDYTKSILVGTLGSGHAVGDTVESLQTGLGAHNDISSINTGTGKWQFGTTGTYYVLWQGLADSAFANTFFKIKNVTQSTYTTLDQLQNPTLIKFNLVTLTVSSTSDEYQLVTTATSSSSKTVKSDGWRLEFYRV